MGKEWQGLRCTGDSERSAEMAEGSLRGEGGGLVGDERA